MVSVVKKRLERSRPARLVDYSARRFPDHQNSPPLLDDWTEAKLSDLAYAARHEHAMGLVDLMFRRVDAGWTKTMGYKDAEKAAGAADKTKREAEAYHAYLKRMHALKVG